MTDLLILENDNKKYLEHPACLPCFWLGEQKMERCENTWKCPKCGWTRNIKEWE